MGGDSDDDNTDEEEDTATTLAASQGAAAATVSSTTKHQALGPAEMLKRITRVEKLGEEILTDRQQVVDLDRRRNTNREALAVFRRMEKQGPAAVLGQKHWTCLSN